MILKSITAGIRKKIIAIHQLGLSPAAQHVMAKRNLKLISLDGMIDFYSGVSVPAGREITLSM